MNTTYIEKRYMGQRVFSYNELNDIFGYSRGRVEEWVKGGFVLCTALPYGTKRVQIVFDQNQLYSLVFFALLLDSGFDRSRAGAYALFMTDKWEMVKTNREKYIFIEFEAMWKAPENIEIDYSKRLTTPEPILENYTSNKKNDSEWPERMQIPIVDYGYPEPFLLSKINEVKKELSNCALATLINIENLMGEVERKISKL